MSTPSDRDSTGSWQPISEAEFEKLFESQYAQLDARAREKFDRFRVPLWRATIRRSASSGDEAVFVVAQVSRGILYFDDVEYGFNIGRVDSEGRILEPGGSQSTLAEAVEAWFPESPLPETSRSPPIGVKE